MMRKKKINIRNLFKGKKFFFISCIQGDGLDNVVDFLFKLFLNNKNEN